MTTEDDFQKTLDKKPNDWQTRLVFADWLQEQGDKRAEGYRLMGLWQLIARHNKGSGPYGCHEAGVNNSWEWWTDKETYDPQLTTCRIPQDLLRKIRSKYVYSTSEKGLTSKDFFTRREADDALAVAFGKLSAPRRAELLAQQPVKITKPRKPLAKKKPAKKAPKKKAK